MFITVKTNDDVMAAINVDQITHMTVAAFSGNGSKIYFTSKDALSIRQTMEEVLAMINGEAPLAVA